VEPHRIQGMYLRGTIGARQYAVLVVEVRPYLTYEAPDRPVEMYSLTIEGMAEGWRIGPWLVDVEASKATEEAIRKAVEATIKRMMGW